MTLLLLAVAAVVGALFVVELRTALHDTQPRNMRDRP